MRESGIYDHWFLEGLQKNGLLIKMSQLISNDFQNLNIFNILGPIYILLFEIIISFIILIFEHLFHKFSHL